MRPDGEVENGLDLVLKQRRAGHYKCWAILANGCGTRRLGLGVKQENNTGASTQFAWFDLDQAIRIRDWLTRYIRQRRREMECE